MVNRVNLWGGHHGEITYDKYDPWNQKLDGTRQMIQGFVFLEILLDRRVTAS